MSKYDIEFYEDINGDSPTYSFLYALSQKKDKQSKVLLKALYLRLNFLKENGPMTGVSDYYDKIEGSKYDLWEIRYKHVTGYYRIFICLCPWRKNLFIVLNWFIKKTQKTPHEEIKKAERLMKDYIDRNKERD